MGLATGTRGTNVVYFQNTETKLVALTIDDAPSRSASEFSQLLDVLKELDIRVTFQIISHYVSSDEHRELLKRAVLAGHQMTNHSTIDQPCINLSKEEFRQRLQDCQALLDELTPGARRWFRPPSGTMNGTMREVLLEDGYDVCMGDCYSSDPQIDDVDYHCRTLSRGARGGSVIIMHCPESNHRHQTLELIPKLVRDLVGRGLNFATLDELFPVQPDLVRGAL